MSYVRSSHVLCLQEYFHIKWAISFFIYLGNTCLFFLTASLSSKLFTFFAVPNMVACEALTYPLQMDQNNF